MVYGTGVIFAETNEAQVVRKREKLKKAFLKIFTLLPFQAMLLGLFVNLTKIELPEVLVNIIDILAKGNKVLVLLIMGIYLSIELKPEIFKKIASVLVIRYAVGLALGFFYITIFLLNHSTEALY
jgi:predicted permease